MDNEVVALGYGLIFDSLSVVIITVISFISLIVVIYSMDYMASDPFYPRFISYLLLFIFLMLVYVSADNLIQAFIG